MTMMVMMVMILCGFAEGFADWSLDNVRANGVHGNDANFLKLCIRRCSQKPWFSSVAALFARCNSTMQLEALVQHCRGPFYSLPFIDLNSPPGLLV